MSEYTSMIHRADRKIHRLENYKRAFNEYADVVQELENRMSSRFQALKNEYEEMKDGKWELLTDILINFEITRAAKHDTTISKVQKNKSDISGRVPYYDQLPELFKTSLAEQDFACTDDGFFLCKKSLEKVITGIGIKENEILNNGSVTAASYDDCYIAGIVNENGEVTYTLIKLREPNDEQGAKGSAVSFVELNIKALSGSLEKVKNGKANYADKNILYTVLFQVTNGKNNPSSKELADANKQLLQYFRDSSSDDGRDRQQKHILPCIRSSSPKENISGHSSSTAGK